MLQRLPPFLLFWLITAKLLFAQSNFTVHSLGKNINTEFDELNPVIAPDGKTLYFTRASHPENNHDADEDFGPFDNQDTWYSELQNDGSWGPAQRMPAPFNSSIYNAILSISEDGKTMLINGTFDKKNKWIGRGLSVCTKNLQGWSAPVKLKIKGKLRKNHGMASNAFLTGDGKLLFLSFSKKVDGKKQDIYVSVHGGAGYSRPKKLSKNINSGKYTEEAPFYNPAEQRLYFSSNRNTSRKNKVNQDIYYSKAIDNTFLKWTDPVRLSDSINSPLWDCYYKLNHKGSWAYFASDKDSKNTSDLYGIKLFEENPYVIISGKVLNKLNHEPLERKHEFTIYANDRIADSISINPDSATFTIKLPLGKKYVVKAEAKNHRAFPDTIDASGLREYTEVNKDLLLEPVPYVLLSGSILVKSTHAPVPNTSDPKIIVDGVEIKYEEIDYEKGTYKIRLKFGKKHHISVNASHFVPEPEVVDLSLVHEFKEMERDLFVQNYVAPDANEAIITGIIYDKKTGKPLSTDKAVKIFANDIPAAEVSINSASAEYKLVVPLGKTYIINASAANYYPLYELVDLSNEKQKIKIIKDLTIAPIEVGMSIKLNNIFFETGKATLKKASFPELDRVAKFLTENPGIKIEIGGHTDNVGKADANLNLSQNRAASVVKYLQKTIASDRLIAKGYGMTKPVANNKTKSGKALNRRVEFTILEK